MMINVLLNVRRKKGNGLNNARKGQVLAIEQIIIFGLGVVLVIFVFTMSFNFVLRVQGEIEEIVGTALLNYVDSAAHTLVDKDAEVMELWIDIPTTVASTTYMIEGKGNYLVVRYPNRDIDKRTDLNYVGEALSNNAKLVLYITSGLPDKVFIR
jgi:hypothetical protein